MSLYDKMLSAIQGNTWAIGFESIDGICASVENTEEASRACERLAIEYKIESLKDLRQQVRGMSESEVMIAFDVVIKMLESKMKQDERD